MSQDYETRLVNILHPYLTGNSLAITWNTPEQAKLHLATIRLMKKQLAMLKKELALDKKAVRDSFIAARGKQRASQGAGRAAGRFIHGGMGKFMRAAGSISNNGARQKLNQQESAALAPYVTMENKIAEVAVKLDQLALEIQTKLAASRF